MLKLSLQKAGTQIFGECCSTTAAHDRTMVPVLGGTAERPFVSKVLIAAFGTAWDGFDTFGNVNAARCGW